MNNEENYYYCNFHMKETLIMFVEEHETYTSYINPTEFIKISLKESEDKKCCCSKVINYIGRDCTAPVRWKLML